MPWRDQHGFNFPTTAEFDPVATVPLLVEGGRLHLGAVIALIVVAVGTVLLGKTIKGFEIRVVGAAPRAARFGGFNSNQLILLTFAITTLHCLVQTVAISRELAATRRVREAEQSDVR